MVALCTLIAAPAGHAEAERTEWNGYPMLNTNKACKDVRFKTKLCHDYMRDLKCPRGDHC